VLLCTLPLAHVTRRIARRPLLIGLMALFTLANLGSAAYIGHGARHVSPEHNRKLAIAWVTFAASPGTEVPSTPRSVRKSLARSVRQFLELMTPSSARE
jgi:hypothetical protein